MRESTSTLAGGAPVPDREGRTSPPASRPLRLSLQRRVTLALLGLVAFFVVTQGVLSYWSMHEQEDDLVNQLLVEEGRRMAERLQVDGAAAEAMFGQRTAVGPYRAWLQRPDGRWVGAAPEGPRAGFVQFQPGVYALEAWNGLQAEHLYVADVPLGRLWVSLDATRHEAQVEEFGLYAGVLALLCVAAAVFASRQVSAMLMQPLQRVTRLMEVWAPAPAGPRPGGAGVDADAAASGGTAVDDETRLFEAFARAQAMLERRLVDEQETAANLRHELRTPLAVLRSDLELLLETLPVDGPQRQRASRALASADAVGQAIDALQATGAAARSADVAPGEDVALADCVALAWDTLGEGPLRRGLRLDNAVPQAAQRHLDRHAVLTVLRNLFGNALEHAAPATVRVLWRPANSTLVIEDDGPGVPADLLPLLFERYVSARLRDASPAAAGSVLAPRGLGLAIARQLAAVHGWGLTAESVQPHGLRFLLQLDVGGTDHLSPPRHTEGIPA